MWRCRTYPLRLYIPDRQTGLLVSKILDHQVEDILPYDIKFQQMSPKQRQKAIHKSLQNLVDEFIARHYSGKVRLTLRGVTDASRVLAYPELLRIGSANFPSSGIEFERELRYYSRNRS